MKISPDNFMLGNFELSEKFVVLIAGNEDSYISAIERKIRNHYYKKTNQSLKRLKKLMTMLRQMICLVKKNYKNP